MEVDIPQPNQALAEVLLSPRIREICFERAETAQFLYQSKVAKRSADLARSARAFTEIGGRRHDRWIGVMLVGFGLIYDPAHEFGYTARGGRTAKRHLVPGAHDLNAVLAELDSV